MTVAPRRTCPACARRYGGLVVDDCPLCAGAGAGIVTLGGAGLSVATPAVAARAVEVYLEAAAGRGCTLAGAIDDLRLVGIIATARNGEPHRVGHSNS